MSTFLACRDGSPLNGATAYSVFAKLLRAAEIQGSIDGHRGPCLHALRHAAAVNRLTAWYRARCRRAAPAAGPCHVSRPCEPEWYAGLPVDDTGTPAGEPRCSSTATSMEETKND